MDELRCSVGYYCFFAICLRLHDVFSIFSSSPLSLSYQDFHLHMICITYSSLPYPQ